MNAFAWDNGVDRRRLLHGAGALAAACVLTPPAMTWAATPPHRFRHGDFDVMVVSDGHMAVRTSLLAPGAPEPERTQMLKQANQTGERYDSPTNVTLIRTRADLILIDAGAGPNFMPTTGKLVANLAAAGIDAGAITKIVFTHAHPDHIWGVTDDLDELQFPNAAYVASAAEWNYWTGEDAFRGISEDRHNFVPGARRSFARIKDRLTLIKPGEEIAPGLRAIDTAGHSPGHIAIEAAGGDGLIVGGDAITHFLLSFRHPGWPSQGDQDQDHAANTRKRLLDRLAAEKAKLIGFHLPYPGLGHVERAQGAYRFAPAT